MACGAVQNLTIQMPLVGSVGVKVHACGYRRSGAKVGSAVDDDAAGFGPWKNVHGNGTVGLDASADGIGGVRYAQRIIARGLGVKDGVGGFGNGHVVHKPLIQKSVAALGDERNGIAGANGCRPQGIERQIGRFVDGNVIFEPQGVFKAGNGVFGDEFDGVNAGSGIDMRGIDGGGRGPAPQIPTVTVGVLGQIKKYEALSGANVGLYREVGHGLLRPQRRSYQPKDKAHSCLFCFLRNRRAKFFVYLS